MKLDVLDDVRVDKTLLALPPGEMNDLRAFLSQEFGIAQVPNGADIFDSIRATCGDRIADEYEALNDRRAHGSDSEVEKATREFFDFISHLPLLGMVHSQKWPLIYDAAAYLTGLARLTQLNGKVLDLGCHAGYHALWLAKTLGCRVKGVDQSGPAIKLAREIGKRHGRTPHPWSFVKLDTTESLPTDRYSLVFSIDGPIDLTGKEIGLVSPILAHDGLIVWIGDYSVDPKELRADLRESGYSLALADVIGGWNGEEYQNRVVLVIHRGEDPRVPDDLMDCAESIWNDGFKQYANTAGRSPSEKTVGLFRTTSRFGS